jgi:hypothetical protein
MKTTFERRVLLGVLARSGVVLSMYAPVLP